MTVLRRASLNVLVVDDAVPGGTGGFSGWERPPPLDVQIKPLRK